MDISETIINNIKHKILHESDYTFLTDTNDNIKLSEHVLLFNTDDKWKIIPLHILLSYPIIYDTCLIDDDISIISIVLCPITLRCVILKGKFIFETFGENYRMILKEENNDNLIPIDIGIKIDKKYIIKTNYRLSTNITTLKNALLIAPDSLIMSTSKEKKYIINKKYYNNNLDINNNNIRDIQLIHPKTLVYVIHYKSFSTQKEKITIILGKSINKDIVTGYNFKLSGLYDYLDKHRIKIINKEGYLMPMLWYMAKNIYNTAKIVRL